ncbi:hypothetical protein PIROE2DRAFT_15763 [Piromyces sp. E2]|nr:hypothetical protein PIROE2DRAFT_15763 [Piromyces sp. E2]|eukprot:OUM58863.1 hypothetical protein PIROE2DRAFT_15763 [Piromyces sp. E2]
MSKSSIYNASGILLMKDVILITRLEKLNLKMGYKGHVMSNTLQYTNKDVTISNLKKRVDEEKKIRTPEIFKAIMDLEKGINETKAQDVIACTIINKNVNKESLSYTRAYDIMTLSFG